MTFVLANCFDGISNGTGVSILSSGGASGWAFDAVTTGTGATVTADTSIVAHSGPAASAKFVTGGTAAQAYISYGASLPTITTAYFRIYGYFTANPASNVSVVQFRSGTSGVNLAGAFVVNTTGTISFIDSASIVQLTSAKTIPLGSWWRLEGYITGSASTGKAEFKCFFTSPDGSTADETKTSGATLNTSGSIQGIRMGIPDALANITLHLDEVLVTDIGYMGPSVASPSCRVGASVFSSVYGASGSLTAAANWDAALGRDMASGPNGVTRRYYQEGELPQTSGADSQNVVTLTSAGIKVVLSFHPWRDSTNAYSGTISGQGITYAQEFTNLQNTLLMYLSNGIQPSQLEFALWHEENGNGQHGPFGDCTQYKGGNPPNGAYTVSNVSQAESNYASYFAFYAPVFSALGLKLTYIPAVFSNNVISGFFPGNVTAALTAYHNAVMTDYYWLDYHNNSNNTLANSISLATTYKLKQGIGEWGFVDGATQPNASQFTSWCTGTTTPPGEILAPLLLFRANGGTVGDVIWFAGSGGSNNITSSSDPSIIASVQEVYDKLTTTPPPLNPSALFPAIPGDAIPGAMSPGDPGSLSPTTTPPGPGTLVNHWIGDLINAPGQCQVTLGGANANGNALICFIGWNDTTFPEVGTVSVADDAHNYWQPLKVNTETNTSIRGAIWIATAANPCQVVCVSSSLPVSSMAVEVCELAGMPQLVQLDLANSAMAVNNTAGYTGVFGSDWVFSLLVSGNNSDTISTSGVFTALPTVAINDPGGAGGPADITLTPMYLQTSGGSSSVGYSSTGIQPLAHTLAAINQTSPTVTNPGNPNWPVFQVLAAFGAQPGAGTANFTWTDITSRAIHGDGDSILDVQKGRSYELTGPEAGTIQLWLNNQDGALTPGNAASPYYPNVLPQTPIKVIATWNNEIFNVAYGYMDKWPQSFDTPQWGFVNAQASDGMGVLANVTMFSALQSEVLFDNPYAYWPLNDSYGEANGLPFTNLGQGISNTKPMVGYDGQSSNSVTLSTGLSINLQGDTGTGIGMSGLTANSTTPNAGTICADPGFPQIGGTGSAAIAIEFWAIMPSSAPSGGGSTFTTPLVSLAGPPTNFGSGGGQSRVRIAATTLTSTTYALNCSLSDYLTNVISTGNVFALPNDGNAHHHVFNITNVSGAWTISHYLDGAFDHSYTASPAFTPTNDIYLCVLGPTLITPLSSNPYNYTIAHVALYNNTLNAQRILSHYTAGGQGFQNDTDNNRFARIMAWSNSHVPNGSLGFAPAPLCGPAFSVGGQAASDALNDLIVSTGGFPYADGSGFVWWVPRTGFYNRAAKWVLSDNPADSGIYYDPSQAFDFDNSFLYIQDTVSRVLNQTSQVTTSVLNGVNSQSFQNTGAIVTLTLPGAQAQYGNRNALSQSVLTTSDEDVYDRANWSLAKYGASSLRVPQIMVDAASNPALWPYVLGAEQGDIVQVKRSPLGGAPYVVSGIIVQTHLETGMNKGQLTAGIIPYNIEANIVQVGVSGHNGLGNGIGW